MKKRIYEIAKERGMAAQVLVERLREAGLEVKSSLSTLDDSEVERALASKAAPATEKPKPRSRTSKTAEAAPGGVAPTGGVAEKPPRAGVGAKTVVGAGGTSAGRRVRAVAEKPATVESAAAEAVPLERPAPKMAAPTSPVAEVAPAKPPVVKPSGAVSGARPVDTPVGDAAPSLEAAFTETEVTRRPKAGASPAKKAALSAVEPARPTGLPGGTPEAAPPSTAPPSSGVVKGAPSSPGRRPMRPRGRGPRLEDLPTVVGPGVPMRKGAKPSGKVLTKEEAAKLAERAAAAAAKPSEPGRPERPAGEAARGPARPPHARPTPPPAPAAGREPQDRRGKGPRPAATTEPPTGGTTWEEGAGAPGQAARRWAGERGTRVRRGDDRPARRRVVIDSQAGRKGGKSALKDKRVASLVEAERPLLKRKAAPGTESPVKVPSGASAKDLGEILDLPASEIIKTLMGLGEMATITQSLADEVITILAEEFERQIEIEHAEEEIESPDAFVDAPEMLSGRSPVVTVMGHVDHGKTSLLDSIRETEVAKSEAGGITQHIGAYQVTQGNKKVTFIDTPGHEAFTAMRARGAKVTDVAVIVVAANDGVMPQTLEAISHARAAEVPIVVAINKIDLPDANPDHVRHQLSEQGLVPEDWGGDTVTVEVSAKQHVNLDELMEMILLVAEVQELKANADAPASGYVIEAQLDVGRGPVATMLVKRGTLHVGDSIVSGEAHGRVKAMFDFTGKPLAQAGPSVPVQILGFNTVPQAGDFMMAVKDERDARRRSEARSVRLRQELLGRTRAGAHSLEEFYRRLKEGRVKELPLVVKGDVAGSVEALEEALRNVSHPEVKVQVIYAGVGGINESDVMLAAASNAVVIGFNVRPSAAAKALAEQEQVDVRTYRVIYKAIEDVEAALVGMLEPEKVEEEVGTAEIRKVFRSSKVGTIAGCYILTGKLTRSAHVRVVRGGSIVHEGTISSLKRFADDVREAVAGYECGLHLDGFEDVQEGDIVEAYEIKEVARTG